MKKQVVANIIIFLGLFVCCNLNKKPKLPSNFFTVGAMKDVMWSGELGPKISLDSLTNIPGLYGIGPESYLSGEILINNGITYVSRVVENGTMKVTQTNVTSAPFFVYSIVRNWDSIALPKDIKSISDLEKYIDESTTKINRPFAFKLEGRVSNGTIHVQNLPEGVTVSSPTQAHQGQVNYKMDSEMVTIIGFFSTDHKGVFTHHDSYLHLHLITKDKQKMGHLDAVNLQEMTLYLPKQ